MNVTSLELPGVRKIASGKVREIFDLGDRLLFVATDRISAFDCVLPEPVPGKGEVLTALSAFWFRLLDFVPNHFQTENFAEFPAVLHPYQELLEGRSMLVKKARPLPVECVVRGYLAGSGWKEYERTGTVCSQPLPPGLGLSSKLPAPIFTPSTKAASGHDENICWKECRRILGDDLAFSVRRLALELYEHGRDYAAARGIVIADTKFEFGLAGDDLILIDECLTPDSSRFWPVGSVEVGTQPPSFDKQFVRDYLESTAWDKTPPAPSLPPEIILKTSEKYRDALRLLTAPRMKA